MLYSSNAFLQLKRKDAFTSVASAICTFGQIAIENHSFDHIHAALKCIIANTIASSSGLVVTADLQSAH